MGGRALGGRVSHVKTSSTIKTLVVHLTLTAEEDLIFKPQNMCYLMDKGRVGASKKRSRSIDNVLSGRFVSAEIRDILLQNYERQNDHSISGSTAVLEALDSERKQALVCYLGTSWNGENDNHRRLFNQMVGGVEGEPTSKDFNIGSNTCCGE